MAGGGVLAVKKITDQTKGGAGTKVVNFEILPWQRDYLSDKAAQP